MRKKVIAGNWKMNMTVKEGEEFLNGLNGKLNEFKNENLKDYENTQVIIAPPFTMLYPLGEKLKALNSQKIELAAQNVNENEKGAYTGEVSIEMLKEIGVNTVIVGHSERRMYYNENNVALNKKIKALFSNNMTPIFCVGESLEERELGIAKEVVENQIKIGLKSIEKENIKKLIIAYEPIWAIGTGKTATSDEAEEMISFIRTILCSLYKEASKETRILYGGSVSSENISSLINKENIDGALVGGKSLQYKNFFDIISCSKK